MAAERHGELSASLSSHLCLCIEASCTSLLVWELFFFFKHSCTNQIEAEMSIPVLFFIFFEVNGNNSIFALLVTKMTGLAPGFYSQ